MRCQTNVYQPPNIIVLYHLQFEIVKCDKPGLVLVDLGVAGFGVAVLGVALGVAGLGVAGLGVAGLGVAGLGVAGFVLVGVLVGVAPASEIMVDIPFLNQLPLFK